MVELTRNDHASQRRVIDTPESGACFQESERRATAAWSRKKHGRAPGDRRYACFRWKIQV